MNLPKPTRLAAFLPSAGLSERRATRHAYAETKLTTDTEGDPMFEFIFVCTKTNSRRRYGCSYENLPRRKDPTELIPEAEYQKAPNRAFHGTGIDDLEPVDDPELADDDGPIDLEDRLAAALGDA